MVSGLSGNRGGNGVGSVDAERNVQNEEAPEGRALPSESSGWGFMKNRGGQGGGAVLRRCSRGRVEREKLIGVGSNGWSRRASTRSRWRIALRRTRVWRARMLSR